MGCTCVSYLAASSFKLRPENSAIVEEVFLICSDSSGKCRHNTRNLFKAILLPSINIAWLTTNKQRVRKLWLSSWRFTDWARGGSGTSRREMTVVSKDVHCYFKICSSAQERSATNAKTDLRPRTGGILVKISNSDGQEIVFLLWISKLYYRLGKATELGTIPQ